MRDIFCGSSSNRNKGPVTHATLCAKWPENYIASSSLTFLTRSGACPLGFLSLYRNRSPNSKRTWQNSPCSVSAQFTWADTHAHAHACTPTPARPQKTCTYLAVVSSPSRGSYASSSACFVFLVLPHPSFVSLPCVSLRLSPISDGSNGPAGVLPPTPQTLNLQPQNRIQTAAMALRVPATRQQRHTTLTKTANSPTLPVLRALTCASHACRSKAAKRIIETPQVLSY